MLKHRYAANLLLYPARRRPTMAKFGNFIEEVLFLKNTLNFINFFEVLNKKICFFTFEFFKKFFPYYFVF